MNRIFLLFILFASFNFSQNSIFVKSTKFNSIESIQSHLTSTSSYSLNKANKYLEIKESNINQFNYFRDSYYLIEIKLEDSKDFQSVTNELGSISGIEFYSKNNIYRIDDFIPNDSLTSEQWSLEKINAFGAWEITKGDPSIIVAIIDTGIDYLHPDLQNQMFINQAEDLNNNGKLDDSDFDGIDNDRNGFIDDVSGWDFVDKFLNSDSLGDGDFFNWDPDPMDENDHGTAMAGILGAESNNSIGLSGVAPNVKILNLRAFDKNGQGEEDDVASAILYAVQMGAKVISMSFGDSEYSQLLEDVIKYAHLQGVVLVGSSGNSGSSDPHFPSGFSEVIAVGATDRGDNVTGFSNFGSTIDIVAPGANVVTTRIGGGYLNSTGTSASAPHVSAAAALLVSIKSFENEEIKQILKTTAEDIDIDNWDIKSGAGRLNLENALLSVNLPSLVKFNSPEAFISTNENSIPINITVLNPRLDKYDLDYGAGLNPENWTKIISEQRQQNINNDIINLNVTLFTDTSYTLRLKVFLTDNTTLEERINFEIDRSVPEINVEKLNSAFYQNAETILASLTTDDETNVTMFYRESGALEFSSTFLDGFSNNLKFWRNKHFGFIPVEEIGSNIEYEIYFEAQNKAGFSSIADNNGQYFKVIIGSDIKLANNFKKEYELPFGRIFKDPLQINNTNFILFNSEEDFQNLSIMELNRTDFQKISSIESRIPKDIGDFNQNGKLDILSLFVRNSFVDEQINSNSVDFTDVTYSQINNFWPILAEDIDSDGLTEIIVIGSIENNEADSILTIWEINRGEAEFEAELQNYSTSRKTNGNSFGAPNAAIGNISLESNDPHPSIWITDLDGDIISYQITAPDNYINYIQYRSDLNGLDNLLDKGDINGDGVNELAVILESDEDRLSAPFYELSLFNLLNDSLKLMFSKMFININSSSGLNFSQTDNSIRFIDINNDFDDELIVFVYPNAYVLDYLDNQLIMIDYESDVNSEHVFFGDVDNNGINEIAFPKFSGIEFYEYDISNRPSVPIIYDSFSITENEIQLKWKGSSEYFRVFRSTDNINFELIDSVNTDFYIDRVSTTNQNYFYFIASYDSRFEIPFSNNSNIAKVFAHKPAEFEKIEIYSSQNIGVFFSGSMSESTSENPFLINETTTNFSITKNTSNSFLINLAEKLEVGEHRLIINGLRDVYNSPIELDTIFFNINSEIEKENFYITSHKVINNNSLEISFNFPHDGNTVLELANYSISNGNTITNISANSTNSVLLNIQYPIGAAGINYTIELDNIYSSSSFGNILIEEGAGSVIDLSFSSNSIEDAYVYPNPIKLSNNDKLKFANLVQNVEIWIFDINGYKIASFKFQNADNFANWDLTDDLGRKISSGIYLIHIRSLDENNEVKEEVTKKFAVLK